MRVVGMASGMGHAEREKTFEPARSKNDDDLHPISSNASSRLRHVAAGDRARRRIKFYRDCAARSRDRRRWLGKSGRRGWSGQIAFRSSRAEPRLDAAEGYRCLARVWLEST